MAKQAFLSSSAILVCATALMAPAPFGAAFAADPELSMAAPKVLVDDCLQSGFQPYSVSVEQRVATCSSALQSHKLTDAQVAVARINRGVARMAIGDKAMADVDYQEALRHYDSAIDAKEPNSLAYYRRGAALNVIGQTDRALADYGEAIRLDPEEPLAYLDRGVVLATRKRAYIRAIADFNRALEIGPNNVEALVHRGDAYGQMGDFARALADLDRAVGLAPDFQLVYFFRGLAQSRRGKNRLALTDFNMALRIHPQYVDALVNRAAIYAADGNADLALGDLDVAIALQKNNPLALYNRGYVHFSKRDYDLAVSDYGSAIAFDPKMGLAYANRCLVRSITGKDLVEALTDCDTASKIMPTNPDVRETRGFIYMKLGDSALAIVEYNAALEHDPNRTLALYGLGLARIRMGHKKEGEADQAAARALNPSVEREFSIYGLK